MMGFLQSIGWDLDCARIALTTTVSNALIDIECRNIKKRCEKRCAQHRKYIAEIESKKSEGDIALYTELLQRVAQHEDFSVRNPMDIAIELGYSEEDVKDAFEYMQQKMNDEEEKD